MAGLQKTFFPHCWDDDARMNNLLSGFPNRSVKRIDWNNKMTFWINLVRSSSEYLRNPIVNYAELQSRFRRTGTAPAGLRTVLDEMVRLGQLQDLSSFRRSLGLSAIGQGWLSWGF